MGETFVHLSSMNFLQTLDITAASQLALLEASDSRAWTVYVRNIPEPIRLPLPTFRLYELSLDNVRLTGPVAFAEGLGKLSLGHLASEQPIRDWVFPSSLEEMLIFTCDVGPLDLTAATGLLDLTLIRPWTLVEELVLPATLEELYLVGLVDVQLPLLPSQLRCLGVHESPQLSDFSRARGVSIDDLAIDRCCLSLAENFPELVSLTVANVRESFPELSHPTLREVAFERCEIPGSVVMNTPRLETLTLDNDLVVPLVGTYAETVTRLTLDSYPEFPAASCKTGYAIDWDNLKELIVLNTPRDTMYRLPWLPCLEGLELDLPVLTRGIEVGSLAGYRAVWVATE